MSKATDSNNPFADISTTFKTIRESLPSLPSLPPPNETESWKDGIGDNIGKFEWFCIGALAGGIFTIAIFLIVWSLVI